MNPQHHVVPRLREIEADVGELLEKGRGGDPNQFDAYRDDPVGFAEQVLRVNLWSRQLEIAVAVRDHSLVTVRSGNSVGKDYVAAVLALWWVFARRGYVLVTGPTDRQVTTILMGEVGRLWRRAALPGELFQRALRVGEKRGVLAFTSNEASKLTGFHAPRVMAVLTEAQGCEPFAFESMHRCATGEDDRILAVGNPVRPVGDFYRIHRRDSGWHSIAIDARQHPNITGAGPFIPGGPTRAWVERIAREYGEQSSIFTYAVAGDFPAQSEEALFNRRSLDEACCTRRQLEVQEALRSLRGWRRSRVFALDVARTGVDMNALAEWEGPLCRGIETFHEEDLMKTARRVVDRLHAAGVLTREQRRATSPTALTHPKYESSRNYDVVVDVIGLGAGVYDRLKEQGWRVHEFNSSRAPTLYKPSVRFLNERAFAYWTLRDGLAAGTVALPYDEELFEELLAVDWHTTGAGKVQLLAKQEIKTRIGRSPDRADACVMGARFALAPDGRVPPVQRPVRWSS